MITDLLISSRSKSIWTVNWIHRFPLIHTAVNILHYPVTGQLRNSIVQNFSLVTFANWSIRSIVSDDLGEMTEALSANNIHRNSSIVVIKWIHVEFTVCHLSYISQKEMLTGLAIVLLDYSLNLEGTYEYSWEQILLTKTAQTVVNITLVFLIPLSFKVFCKCVLHKLVFYCGKIMEY